MTTTRDLDLDLIDPYRDPAPVRVRRTRRTFGIPTGFRTSTIPSTVPVDLVDPYRDPAPSTSTSTSTSTVPVDLVDPYRDPAPSTSTSTSTSTEPGFRVRTYVTAAILAASIITTGQPAAAVHDAFRSTVETWHESVTFCDGAATRTGALRFVERAGYAFCGTVGIEPRGE